MRYTPVELRHVHLGRGLFGYSRDETDKLLEDVIESFEEVWRERGEFADKLEDLEKLLAEVKQREALLASTLVAAERTAAEAIEAAKRQGELIVAEAHQESRSVTRAAQAERERLFAEARRVETLLRSALGLVEESRNDESQASGVDEEWPKRENTREFQAVAAGEPEPDEEDGPWEDRDFAWG
jgi:cell division septum initiation protein DivIVA